MLFGGDWGSNPDNAASSLCFLVVSALSPRSSFLPFHLALLLNRALLQQSVENKLKKAHFLFIYFNDCMNLQL